MKLISILFAGLLISCQSSKLPTERYTQYDFHKSYSLEQNNLQIKLDNPLKCPLRVWIISADENLQLKLSKTNPIELGPLRDTLLTFKNVNQIEGEITFASRLGSISKKVKNNKLELPFPNGKKYKIIQGNNTNFTHNTNYSRYAVDLDLSIRDTVCSATNGFVVGVIDQYKYGGDGDKWKPFGNFITVYDPNSGIFTQYVHLVQNGSLVRVGDAVQSGQPIALSGKTGQTNIEHLHFNCLVPVKGNDGLKSVPYEFVAGYKSKELQKGDIVVKTANK